MSEQQIRTLGSPTRHAPDEWICRRWRRQGRLAGSPERTYTLGMTKLEEIRESVAALAPAEKAVLFQTVASEITQVFAGIEGTPGVSGGDPCIVRTRIPVWVLEQSRRVGMSEIDLLRNYPTLRAQDLANAWSYVLAHRDEIDRQIREHAAD